MENPSTNCFLDNCGHGVEWLALYFYFNSQENEWGYTQYIFNNQWQIVKSIAELKAATIDSWGNIDTAVFQGLVNDMPHRIFQAIYN